MSEEERPWGILRNLYGNSGSQVKKLVVSLGMRVSFQSYKHPSFRRYIVSTLLQLENEMIEVQECNSIDIHFGCRHRITSTSDHSLVFTEVQTRISLDENDTIRNEYDLGRY